MSEQLDKQHTNGPQWILTATLKVDTFFHRGERDVEVWMFHESNKQIAALLVLWPLFAKCTPVPWIQQWRKLFPFIDLYGQIDKHWNNWTSAVTSSQQWRTAWTDLNYGSAMDCAEDPQSANRLVRWPWWPGDVCQSSSKCIPMQKQFTTGAKVHEDPQNTCLKLFTWKDKPRICKTMTSEKVNWANKGTTVEIISNPTGPNGVCLWPSMPHTQVAQVVVGKDENPNVPLCVISRQKKRPLWGRRNQPVCLEQTRQLPLTNAAWMCDCCCCCYCHQSNVT